jgi:hypothetical protein
MLRSFRPQSFWLALGVVSGIGMLVSMAQTSVSRDTWPPPKKDIVNLFFFEPTSQISVPPGASFTVFTVPNDRWLTITGVSGSYATGPFPFWSEELNGAVTEKGQFLGNEMPASPASCGGAIGWTFRPGSTVVIRNDDPTTTALIYSYALIGYLSRE